MLWSVRQKISPTRQLPSAPHEIFRLVIQYVMHDVRRTVTASVKRHPGANTRMFKTTGGDHRLDVSLDCRRPIASRVDFRRRCSSATPRGGRFCGGRVVNSTRRKDGRGDPYPRRLPHAASRDRRCQHADKPYGNTAVRAPHMTPLAPLQDRHKHRPVSPKQARQCTDIGKSCPFVN